MFKKLLITLEMIKFEHTLFALPFALLSLLLASKGWPEWRPLAWILLAMTGARSAAMTFNRIADFEIDSRNPRTLNRALPAGHLSMHYAVGFTAVSSLLFVFAAWQLNCVCFWLSFPVLGILLSYSYAKRFTRYSHFILGLCLGLAPIGVWIAVRGNIGWTPVLLCGIVLLWTAGFDIIYACQDAGFDRKASLYSIPEKYGIAAALRISSQLHWLMVALLLLLFFRESLGWISLSGILLVAALLGYEHSLVRPNDLSRVNAAFFTVNGFISLLLLVTIGLDTVRG
jgi:4-hydroxybenzoate polyprenyltransferase